MGPGTIRIGTSGLTVRNQATNPLVSVISQQAARERGFVAGLGPRDAVLEFLRSQGREVGFRRRHVGGEPPELRAPRVGHAIHTRPNRLEFGPPTVLGDRK